VAEILPSSNDTDISQGGFFVVPEVGIGWFVAQVEPAYQDGRASTRRIRCSPRNPNYRPFELTLGTEAKIAGVCRITKHCKRSPPLTRRATAEPRAALRRRMWTAIGRLAQFSLALDRLHSEKPHRDSAGWAGRKPDGVVVGTGTIDQL